MNLYQLTTEFKADAESLADLDLDEQTLADTLEGMRYPVEVKAQNVAAFVLNLDADVEAIKSAESRIVARRKAIEARAARLREYLKSNMEACGITEIAAQDKSFAIRLKQNPESVLIDDESLIPELYKRSKTVVEPDKNAIKAAIKSGDVIAGCRLARSTKLEIK